MSQAQTPSPLWCPFFFTGEYFIIIACPRNT
jgi:hypothetical protein